MGYEYRLSPQGVTSAALGEAVSAVQRLEGASTTSEGHTEFRRNALDVMPDATLILEGEQIYFCDHGASGRDYLGRVMPVLVSRCGPILVEEYE